MKKVLFLISLLTIQSSTSLCTESITIPANLKKSNVSSILVGGMATVIGYYASMACELAINRYYLLPTLISGAGLLGVITKLGTIYPSEFVWDNLNPTEKCATLFLLSATSIGTFKYIQAKLQLRKCRADLKKIIQKIINNEI
jgi:hypothetical protein